MRATLAEELRAVDSNWEEPVFLRVWPLIGCPGNKMLILEAPKDSVG